MFYWISPCDGHIIYINFELKSYYRSKRRLTLRLNPNPRVQTKSSTKTLRVKTQKEGAPPSSTRLHRVQFPLSVCQRFVERFTPAWSPPPPSASPAHEDAALEVEEQHGPGNIHQSINDSINKNRYQCPVYVWEWSSRNTYKQWALIQHTTCLWIRTCVWREPPPLERVGGDPDHIRFCSDLRRAQRLLFNF